MCPNFIINYIIWKVKDAKVHIDNRPLADRNLSHVYSFAAYMMARAIVLIVRHGETDENRQRIVQGQLNTVLNAAGLDQARRVAGALRANSFDVAFSSDLSRAVKVE